MQESEFIDWIYRQKSFSPHSPSSAVQVGPGDDCAVVAFGNEQLLVTVDQVLDGVHFILSEHGPESAGRKALARNLSDIAAMAGTAVGAVVSVSLPKDFSLADAQQIYAGLRRVGDEFNCPVIGGDVAAWDGKLGISVTVLGRAGERGPVLRSGAQASDAICVTGNLGGAWKSDRHMTFTPRIKEASALAEKFDLHAMIDISDGLAGDLYHICSASGMGAEIRADDLPIHPDATLAAALGDGEDYELLFTLPAGQTRKMIDDPPTDVKITRIGTITAAKDVMIVVDGNRQKLEPSGWQHKT